MRRVGAGRGEPGSGRATAVRGRTLLVIGDDMELAVALRDRLDRAYVTVCEVRPAEAAAAVQGCRPWPWMVIGDGSIVPDVAVSLLARVPALLLWRGARPAGLPPHSRAFERYSEVAAAAEEALGADVGGMRLARGEGVTMPDGQHASSAPLDVLVASHPRPLFAAFRHFRSVDATLAAHGVSLRVARTGDGGVRLDARGA